VTDQTVIATDQRVLLFQALQPAEAANLVAVMTRIVPHQDPRLRDVVWYTASAYDARLTTDVQLRNEIRDLLKELDQQAAAQGAKSFADASAELQVTLLKAVEDTALFQNLVFAVVADFYNRHLVWEAIGYPGLAQRDGKGYLNQGFDVLDWGKPTV
jgi:hypothetical protein